MQKENIIMASYTVELSPALVNLGTEGSLDTSVVNGNSIQRTVHGMYFHAGGEFKMVGRIADGGSFTDTIESISDLDFIV